MQNTEGWKAARFTLRCGIRAAFSHKVTADFIEEFDRNVDETFQRYSRFLTEGDKLIFENDI